MKHLILKLCSILLFSLLMTNIQAQSIYVINKSGIQTGYPLTSLKTITFAGTTLNFNKKNGATESAFLSDVKLLTFSPLTEIVSPQATEADLNIYPNPVRNQLNLQFKAQQSTQATDISIFSIDGKLVYSNKLQHNIDSELHVNTSTWLQGIYILRVNNNNELISRKIIKN